MDKQRYVVMGAGEVGYHLARNLSGKGHDVVVIDVDPARVEWVADSLDALVVEGDGTYASVLERAGMENVDLFMGVSSNGAANLVSSSLAKGLGARRCVVRVGAGGQMIQRREVYEQTFGIDLLLSTQLLTTSRILNRIRGHNTVAVESFADGKVQLRKIHLEQGSPLTGKPLGELGLPRGSMVAALFRGDELIIPSGADAPQPGDEALIIGKGDVLQRFEEMVAQGREELGLVVIAGAGETGLTVARALETLNAEVKIIEQRRERAEELAKMFPSFEILHGDMTDLSLLKAERLGRAKTFVALSGHDETNLMANLLAQELGIETVMALVQRSETTHLWRRLGLPQVLSPRALAHERVQEYIDSGYRSNILSLGQGLAQVLERRLHPASPAAGVTLAEMNPPRGLIVAAVSRGGKVFVPGGNDRLEAGDLVILFVHRDELGTVQLLFPGKGA